MNGRELAALAGQEGIVVIRRAFAQWLGTVGAALLLDQLLFDADRSEDEWFAVRDTDWQDRLLLSRREVERARTLLTDMTLIETKIAGLPSRMYYRVDSDAVAEGFGLFVSGGATSRHIEQSIVPHLAPNSATSGTNSIKPKGLKPKGVEEGVTTAAAEKPKPELTSVQFRMVFEALLRVRRVNARMATEAKEKVHARRIASKLTKMVVPWRDTKVRDRHGRAVVDADMVLEWGGQWYDHMAKRTGKTMREVEPPTWTQLQDWLARRYEETVREIEADQLMELEGSPSQISVLVDEAFDKGPADVLWADVLRGMEGQGVQAPTLAKWLGDARPVAIDQYKGTLTVRVGAKQIEFVSQRLSEQLVAAVRGSSVAHGFGVYSVTLIAA